jgi:hypothetical protein
MTGLRQDSTRRRALELLASCRDGCTEAIMLPHGLSVEQIVELVRGVGSRAWRPSASARAKT